MDHPHQEQQQLSPSLPVLTRLDRLDRLLLLLEERQCLSTRNSSSPSVIRKMKTDDDQCKPLSSALEEVNHKGTLMERLTNLEKRVLALSLEIAVGNTSRSSSSTLQMTEKFERKSTSAVPGKDDEHIINNFQVTPTFVEASSGEGKSKGCQKDRRGRRSDTLLPSKKWYGWFRMGC